MKQENNDSKICPICGRPTHKKSKHCIFHASAEEKTEEEFKKALKEYILKIKKEDKDYDFKRFIFVGNIDFRKDLSITIFKKANFGRATFEGNAFFEGATFEGNAYFRKTTFEGYINFSEATFQGDIDFRGATFKEDADFSRTIFKGRIDFLKTTFQGDTSFIEAIFDGNAYFDIAIFRGVVGFCNATFKVFAYFKRVTFEGISSFRRATFKIDADFNRTVFEGNAYFDSAIFQRNVDFLKVTFQGDADFTWATFEGDTCFEVKSFEKDINFAKANLFPGKELNFKVENNKGDISFERAYLENTYLKIYLGTDVLIDFTDALLRNTTIEKDQIENHILQEEKKEFSKAQRVYLLLKNNFHSNGQYEDESWAFMKEREMERKGSCHFKTLHKWLWSCFLNGIFGYGEQPGKVIVSAILVILLFASLFMIFGISNIGIEFSTSNNFLDCMYFSTITFTTLGYGDFRPLEGWGRVLAGSEAFIGAFMMALFVYTFARKTGGR